MKELVNRIEYLKGQRDNIIENIKTKEKDLRKNKRTLENVFEAQVVLQKAAQMTQEKLEYYISDMVNLALSSIFGDMYTFSLSYESKRGQSEASMKVFKDSTSLSIMDDIGGGVVDVIAFALRIASWKICQPFSTRPVIILDEPFRFLSSEFQILAGDMITSLSKNLNLQFIIVTHSENLMGTATKIFEVGISRRKSHVIDIGRKRENKTTKVKTKRKRL